MVMVQPPFRTRYIPRPKKAKKVRLSALLEVSVHDYLEILKKERSWPKWLTEIQGDFKKTNEEKESLRSRLELANNRLRELGMDQY